MASNNSYNSWVWVFHGVGARFASGVFASLEEASKWIEVEHLTGVLTAYPLNEGAYAWAVRTGAFVPKGPEQCSPGFVQKFSSASQLHAHFEDGKRI